MKLDWRETSGYAMILCASSFWGGAASGGKTLMRAGISTVQLMEIRSVISSIVLLVLLAIFGRQHLRVQKRDLAALTLLAIPGVALVNASYYQAVQLLPVAVAAFIQFTAPVLVFLYGVAMRTERASIGKFIALLLSLTGTYLMLRMNAEGTHNFPVFGLVCALVSMVTYAFYLLLSHRLSAKHSSWTIILYSYGIASLFWCVVQNPVQTAELLSHTGLWQEAMLFSIYSTLIPFSLFLLGLRRVSPTGASIASTSETISAALFAFLFLGETLAGVQIVGGGLILFAVTILILHPRNAG